MSEANTTGASQAQTENANSRPRPHTIIRLLSTKFQPRAPNATPANQPLPPPPTAASKEQRDAALRAVGLLPPLRANKDLSLQEMEQDQHIPIVSLPQSETSTSCDPSKVQAPSTTEAQPSAADLIKKEWVTKNQPTTTSTDESSASQLDRLSTFKFGGSTPSLVVPLPSSDPEPAPTVDGSLSHVSPDQLDIPVPTPPTSPPDQSGSVSSSASRDIPPSPLETSNGTATSPQAPTESPSVPSRPPSPLIEIPEEIKAYMFPLPPSRKASSSSLRSAAPSSPPPNRELPPLPQTPTVPELVLTPSKDYVSVSLMVDGDAGPSDINNNNITVTPQSIPSGESGTQKEDGAESGTLTPRPNVVEHNVNDNDGELLSNLNIPVPNPVLIPAIEIQSPAPPSGTDVVAEAEAEAEATPSSDSEPPAPVQVSTPPPAPTSTPTPTPAEVEETLTALTASTNTSDSENDVGSPSISSIKTPSLDSSSQTTSSDSCSTEASSPTPKPLVLAPGRLGSLHVKTTGAERVPSVVIASPVELHRFSEELDVVIEDEGDGEEVPVPVRGVVGLEEQEKEEREKEVGEMGELNMETGKEEGNKGTETPKASKMNTLTPAPASAPPTTLIFPADATKASPSLTPPKKSLMDRRKTLNPFKRSQTVGPSSSSRSPSTQPGASATNSTPTTSATTTEPKRRLTVGSSFSNIRRSVVGTLSSKPKVGSGSGSGNASAAGSSSISSTRPKRGKTFDASHLPPSPTIPSSFIGSLGSRGSGGSGGRSGGGGGGGSAMRLSPPPTPTSTSTRLARPVVIHTGGSILEQTAGIEDDETRRMTELAFM